MKAVITPLFGGEAVAGLPDAACVSVIVLARTFNWSSKKPTFSLGIHAHEAATTYRVLGIAPSADFTQARL
jgi:hypothetical protein